MLNKLFVERVIKKKADLLNGNMNRFNALMLEVVNYKKELNEFSYKSFNLFNHYTSLNGFKKCLDELKNSYIEAYERELVDFYVYVIVYKHGKVKQAVNNLKNTLDKLRKTYQKLCNRYDNEVVKKQKETKKKLKELKIEKEIEIEKEKEKTKPKRNYEKHKKKKK